MKRLLILFASLAVLGLVAAQTLRTLSYDPDTGIVLWGGGTNALTLPASVSPSWQLLPATNGVATITTNEFGVGWDDQGRFTLSTPVGMIQMYGSGDPVQPTLYFNGTLVAQRFDAININGIVYAKNIEGGAGSPGGIISPPVVEDSFLGPFRQWTSGRSASNGVPWELTTNGFSAPIPGNYIPYVDAGVDDETGQTVKFNGRYVSPEEFMEMMPTPRSGAAPTNAVLQADGNGGSAFSPVPGTNAGEILVYDGDGGMSSGGMWRIVGNELRITVTGSVHKIRMATNGLLLSSDATLRWSDATNGTGSSISIMFTNMSKGRFGLVSTNESTELGIYGSFTNTNNYRRLSTGMGTNGVAYIRAEGAGTGASNNEIHISTVPTNTNGLEPGTLWNSNGVALFYIP